MLTLLGTAPVGMAVGERVVDEVAPTKMGSMAKTLGGQLASPVLNELTGGSPALSGAASGALAGSALGPWGAVAGAFTGGLGGMLGGGKKASEGAAQAAQMMKSKLSESKGKRAAMLAKPKQKTRLLDKYSGGGYGLS